MPGKLLLKAEDRGKSFSNLGVTCIFILLSGETVCWSAKSTPRMFWQDNSLYVIVSITGEGLKHNWEITG